MKLCLLLPLAVGAVIGQAHDLPTLRQGKRPQGGCVGPRSRTRRYAEEKNHLPLSET